MSEDHLLYRVENHTAYLTINRAKQRNAISAKAIALFLKYLDEAEEDDRVRVVVVTGEGDRAFCSGADLGKTMGYDPGDAFQKYANLMKRLSGFPKPTVARVNGTCLAGGTGFMLACDIVIAVSNAKFGTPEVNVGLFPMMIGALIFRNVLRKKAMEMVLLGELMDADQACEMGMVTRVVPPEDLDGEVEAVVAALASKSPLGMKMGKEAFLSVTGMPLDHSVDYLSNRLMDVMMTEDAREGISAFMEKRKPVFTGN